MKFVFNGPRVDLGRWGIPVAITIAGVGVLVFQFLIDHGRTLHLSSQTSLLLAIGVLILAAAGTVLTLTDTLRGQREAQQKAVQRTLALPPTRSGQLRRVREVSAYKVGVAKSLYADSADPYIRRKDVDDLLDEAMLEQSFVLLVGPSMAGKSRTAFEAVRRLLPEATLLVPAPDPDALQELFGADSPVQLGHEPVVVWLDDLDRFLDSGALGYGLLERLAERKPRVLVIATLTTLARQRLTRAATTDPGEMSPVYRSLQVLDHAFQIDLPGELTQTERREAIKCYPKESFADSGIGEQLAGVRHLLDKYREGADEPRPLGWAVVQAAVDWRRTGMVHPIPEMLLRELAVGYLSDARVNLEPEPEDFHQGLAWALQPAVSRVALLERVSGNVQGPGYRALNHLIAVCDGQGVGRVSSRLMREQTWEFVLAHTSPGEILKVGVTAYTRDERSVADSAWEQVAASGDAAVGEAALLLGGLREEEGNFGDALSAWRSAGGLPGVHVSLWGMLTETNDPNTPIAVVFRQDDWSIGINWELHGPRAASLSGAFHVRLLIHDVHGVGPTRGELGQARVPVDWSPGPRRAYQSAWNFPAGIVSPGLYQISVVITHHDGIKLSLAAAAEIGVALFSDE
jgi:hypothetical protein